MSSSRRQQRGRPGGRDEAREAFTQAHERWSAAIGAHRMAPPDAGFARRLGDLAEAAEDQATGCETALQAGYEWRAIPGAEDSAPPYELQPGTGRRGPIELWETFDLAVAQVNRASATNDLSAVAHAYRTLSDAARALSHAVAEQDQSETKRRGAA